MGESGALLLRYRVAQESDATIVQVAGEIDLATSDEFAQAVAQALAGSSSKVVVDLRDVTFMGSIGLSVLLSAHRDAEQAGRSLRVADGGAIAHRAITISGLDQVLAVFGTVDDAVRG
ncbi:STAS domain-containing protein [Actinocrispum sp. NPDC049592]|uniref:STAS domain-containing protein n=1 Tax=Actinocrispum sp. NPDC049592 TaxID=3154835 RepID=UPI003449BC18